MNCIHPMCIHEWCVSLEVATEGEMQDSALYYALYYALSVHTIFSGRKLRRFLTPKGIRRRIRPLLEIQVSLYRSLKRQTWPPYLFFRVTKRPVRLSPSSRSLWPGLRKKKKKSRNGPLFLGSSSKKKRKKDQHQAEGTREAVLPGSAHSQGGPASTPAWLAQEG